MEMQYNNCKDYLRINTRKGKGNMRITIIHGQSHKGSTYHIAHILAEKLGGEITEFYLPKDFGTFCTGCTNCFAKSETLCPHYEQLKPITNAFDNADVIIMASPVYVYHSTGAMKTLLDHYGYRWMVHRPNEKMFKKQAVCISTAAGAGMKSTNKDMADSMFFWGISKIYTYGESVRAVSWEKVDSQIKKRIEQKATIIANKIKKNSATLTPSLKTKMFFYVMRLLQKKGLNKPDMDYWQEKGWIEKARPWKM